MVVGPACISEFKVSRGHTSPQAIQSSFEGILAPGNHAQCPSWFQPSNVEYMGFLDFTPTLRSNKGSTVEPVGRACYSV